MPVSVSHVADDGYQQRESVALIGFEDVEEIVVLEEAHGTVRYL